MVLAAAHKVMVYELGKKSAYRLTRADLFGGGEKYADPNQVPGKENLIRRKIVLYKFFSDLLTKHLLVFTLSFSAVPATTVDAQLGQLSAARFGSALFGSVV